MNADEIDALLDVVSTPVHQRVTIADRVQALEDREAIRGLIMRYGLSLIHISEPTRPY